MIYFILKKKYKALSTIWFRKKIDSILMRPRAPKQCRIILFSTKGNYGSLKKCLIPDLGKEMIKIFCRVLSHQKARNLSKTADMPKGLRILQPEFALTRQRWNNLSIISHDHKCSELKLIKYI